jgi:RimJ/RimL family protein N-acetyltransferase
VPPLRRLAHGGSFTISIHPRWQGKGLGRVMTQAALDWAKEAGLAQVNLTVFASNGRARKLYESLGFIEQGIRRGYVRYEDGRVDDDVLMVWEANSSGDR